MSKIILRAILPRDRTKSGWLTVEVDGVVKDDYPVLGDGVGGGEFDKNGDTPTGTYIGTFEPSGSRSVYSYGPNGVVKLEPTGGNALLAKQMGRDLLRIHGGAPRKSSTAPDGLRPTFGCLRVEDGNMARLRMHIEDAQAKTDMSYVGGNIEAIVEDL